MINVLRLNLKRKWWEQIRDGQKETELRLVTDYWRKRLVGRHYDEIHLLLGYPNKGDESRIIKRKWKGHFVATVKHEEFGTEPVDVFCIDVSEPVGPLNQDSTQVEIPNIRCPECGGKLFASVHEWDIEAGRPTTCGIQIDCANENWDDDGTDHNHRWFQSDWQRIVDKVNQWAKAVEV